MMMKYVIDDICYYLEEYGEGEPLVLLHGFTGDSSSWHSFYDEWGEVSRIIAIDIIGHGKTDSPEDVNKYQIEKVAFHLFLLLEKLGVKQTDILGYSMGGRLALTFSILYPAKVRKLILESTTPGLESAEERKNRRILDGKLGDYIKEKGIVNFVHYWENIPLFESQKNISEGTKVKIRKQRLNNSAIGLINSLKGMGTGAQPSWWGNLVYLKMEVLLITGSKDKKFCQIANRMKTKLLNAKLITIENCGHAIHVEEPEKFGTIVKEFVL